MGGGRSRGRAWAAATALVAGVVLIALSVPRLGGGVVAAAGEGTLAEMGRGERVLGTEIMRAIESRTASLGWHESGRGWSDLGALYLSRSHEWGYRSRAGAAYLDHAIAAFRSGLALAPAQPFAWMMLTQATVARHGAAARPAPLLRMAIITAPGEPALVLPRVAMGLALWHRLTPEIRALISHQVRIAARHAPETLATTARKSYSLKRVRGMLAADAALLQLFDRAYLARRG